VAAVGVSLEKREEPKVPESFITLFRESLEKSGFTVVEVAEKVDLSQSYLSRLLSRERGLPPDEKIIQLAKALKIDPPEALLVAAGKLPATKGHVDSSKIDESLRKIEELSRESKAIKEAAKKNAVVATALVGILGLAGLILGLVALYKKITKGLDENEA